MTCGELYSVFKTEYPEITTVGKSTFFSVRPKNVLLASSTPHRTCHCKYHDNILLFLEALHKACDKTPTYSSAFPESSVCDSPTYTCLLLQYM